MKIKFDVKKHLLKDFPIYLLVIVSIPIITSYAIELKNKPKDYEIFTFVSGANLTNKNTLSTLVRNTGQIKEINISAFTYNEYFFNTVQANFSIADIIILPKTYNDKEVVDNNLLANFLPLVEDEFYNDTNYIVDGVHYGININKLSEQFSFAKCDYYLYIMKNSVHVNHWNNSSKTDIVYTVLKEYLK